MKEMLWAAPPSTIELYTIKKQMTKYPQLKHVKNVLDLSYTDKQALPQEEWSQMLSAPNPSSTVSLSALKKQKSEISTFRQV